MLQTVPYRSFLAHHGVTNCYPRKTMQPAKPPVLKAILTDVHFWLPFAVLIIGIALLAVLR
jgi:hypothetical protein